MLHCTTPSTARISTRQRDGLTICSVSAHCDDGCFPSDCAVLLKIEPEEPVGRCMADVLYSPFWCRPQFGTGLSGVPKNTQALLWQTEAGTYGYILPLCCGDYVCSLESREDGLYAVIRSNCDSLRDCETTAFIAGEHENPYDLMHRCAAAAAETVGNGLRLREDRPYPEIFEYLGWCTWDAMEIWVNEEDILTKCAEFQEKGIPIRWLILDDMWADIAWTQELPLFTPHDISFGVMHASKMRDYEADPKRFPHGLAGCIDRIRSQFGLKTGVWHPINGYWAGLLPDSAADRKLKGLTLTGAQNTIVPDLTDAEQAGRYYAALHSFFASCGAEFVKIDNQSALRANYRDICPIGEAARNLHEGIEKSVGTFFDGAMINCMGMASENMFSRSSSAISRCSDDFQPENRAWFAKHVMQCAYNGLVQGQFYTNDWDMWWSDDAQAEKNSLLRALSGGPIYVSDRLGRSRPEIFAPLSFSDGRILRPDRAAVPAEDCLLADMTKEPRPLKVLNTAGGTVYAAALNLHTDGTAVEGTISPAEFYGFFENPQAPRFLLYEYFSGSYRILTLKDVHSFTLKDADDFRLFSLTPVRDGTALVGDVSKFISIRAVTSSREGYIQLYEGGRLKLYHEKPIQAIVNRDGAPLPFEKDGAMYTVETGGWKEIYYR